MRPLDDPTVGADVNTMDYRNPLQSLVLRGATAGHYVTRIAASALFVSVCWTGAVSCNQLR